MPVQNKRSKEEKNAFREFFPRNETKEKIRDFNDKSRVRFSDDIIDEKSDEVQDHKDRENLNLRKRDKSQDNFISENKETPNVSSINRNSSVSANEEDELVANPELANLINQTNQMNINKDEENNEMIDTNKISQLN